MPKPISLTVLKDGPLRVSGENLSASYCGTPLAVSEGQDLYLCRCGESDNAPFCDGSHAKVGFKGASEEGRSSSIKVWEGKSIRTYFNPGACMHVFYCKPLKELRERELQGDAAAAAEIAKVVRSCPSGALSYEAVGEQTGVPEPPAVEGAALDIREGGEIRVQCEFEIDAPLQERQVSDRATLCRCGLSANKPWCDGRHRKREGFR